MRALTILSAVLALSLGVFASPILAGGWAVTTLDDLPNQFVSGQEYTLGYTIRQHGQTPINVDKTEIVAIANTGRTLSFPGKSDGVLGHYVASVFFPAGGAYTWRVTQGPFEAQELGTLTVLAAAGISTADKATTADRAAADKAASDKAIPADKAAAAEKAVFADKAASAEKAAASEKAAVASKAAVAEKAVTTGTSPSTPATQNSDPVRTALPFAAAAAVAMFLWRVVTMLRTQRRTRVTV